jgi:alpha-ketoglutarate-dependent taurine dioxygenase
MSLTTRPLHPTLACEVGGLALWEKPAAATVAALRELWARYGVLLFRRQALGEAEFAEFSAEIYAAALRPEHLYTHSRQVGDVLLWDNGFTMHRREPFDPAARRLMKRTTMILDATRHIVPEGELAEMPAAA